MSSIDNKLTVLYDTIIIIIGVTFIINFISNEDESNQLKFVNITDTNNCKGQYDLEVYRKNVITNFKLNQTLILTGENVWSQKYLHDEINIFIGKKWK